MTPDDDAASPRDGEPPRAARSRGAGTGRWSECWGHRPGGCPRGSPHRPPASGAARRPPEPFGHRRGGVDLTRVTDVLRGTPAESQQAHRLPEHPRGHERRHHAEPASGRGPLPVPAARGPAGQPAGPGAHHSAAALPGARPAAGVRRAAAAPPPPGRVRRVGGRRLAGGRRRCRHRRCGRLERVEPRRRRPVHVVAERLGRRRPWRRPGRQRLGRAGRPGRAARRS